ncbi:MAG: aspartate aminotransferase family protein [Alphaproteobacteria bacterium]|nr:aspartate aminotransferase family protein [Alphaproteobacteria bacterium]
MKPNNLESLWMPFTPNKSFKKDPRIIVGAKDMHFISDDGRDILDATAGLWCVNAGHGRKKIQDAVYNQIGELDYSPPFQFGHPKQFELANRLAEMFPEKMNHVFFSNSGSEAVDSALKIALAYQRARGKASKTRLIGRERGYHGVGFGGISVGGMVKNRMYFGSLLSGVDHLRHTHNPQLNSFSKGLPEHGAELADDLERIVQLHDASTIAAVIVEPIAGSTGVLPPPKGYLKRLRELCTKHDILLIFDEVISAFGRMGTPTASEYFNVTPDIICCAKALTNAVIPMGATVVQDHIYESMLDNADAPIELFHGYTYSGHPVACAAALASLDIYKEEGLFERAVESAKHMQEAAHSLKGTKNVIDIRNMGLIAAVEIQAKEGAIGARGFETMKKAWDLGVMIRANGDTIAFSPPLIVENNQIDQMFDATKKAIESIN